MTIIMTPGGDPEIGTTTATLYTNNYAGSGSIEMQIAARPDFQFCVCPTFPLPRQAAQNIIGLNQRQTLYARARTRLADGTVEDWSNVVGFRTKDGAAQIIAPAAVMIEPAMFVVPEPIIGHATASIAGFPAENLWRDTPAAWKGTVFDSNDYRIYVQTAGGPIDTIALLNTNIPEGAQTLIAAGPSIESTNSGNGVSFFQNGIVMRASANLPGRPGYHALIRLPQPISAPWWSIRWGGATPGNYCQVEHLVMGRNRVTKNHALEKQESPAPLTTIDRKRSGVPDRVRGRPMRKVDFELQMLTEAQYETIYGDLWRYENEPVLVVPNSKAGGFLHDRILFGDLSGGRIVNPSSPRYNRGFTVNSII